LVKDDQDQAYHQYVFDGLEGLSAAVSPECASLLDENCRRAPGSRSGNAGIRAAGLPA